MFALVSLLLFNPTLSKFSPTCFLYCSFMMAHRHYDEAPVVVLWIFFMLVLIVLVLKMCMNFVFTHIKLLAKEKVYIC